MSEHYWTTSIHFEDDKDEEQFAIWFQKVGKNLFINHMRTKNVGFSEPLFDDSTCCTEFFFEKSEEVKEIPYSPWAPEEYWQEHQTEAEATNYFIETHSEGDQQ